MLRWLSCVSCCRNGCPTDKRAATLVVEKVIAGRSIFVDDNESFAAELGPTDATELQRLAVRSAGPLQATQVAQAVDRSTYFQHEEAVPPRPPEPVMEPRFQALDTLRGLAALWVSALHLERGAFFLQGWNGAQAPALYLCVDFFLVLSGFVLSHGRTLHSGKRTATPASFVLQRLGRLWPLHAAAAATTLLARYMSGMLDSLPPYTVVCDAILEIAMLHNIGLPYPQGAYNNMPSWSVSCEFWISAAFGFCDPRDGFQVALLAALGVLGQWLVFISVGHLDVWNMNSWGFVNIGLVRCASSFLLGVAGYWLHTNLQGARISVVLGTVLEAVLSAAVVALICVRDTHHSPADFLAPWLFLLVVLCFAGQRGWLSQVFVRLRGIGTVSYSLYLNQWTVLLCMKMSGVFTVLESSVVTAIATFWAVLVPYSCLTYLLIESPALRLSRTKEAKLEPPKRRRLIQL